MYYSMNDRKIYDFFLTKSNSKGNYKMAMSSNLNEMILYCVDRYACWRRNLLGYFGEDFGPEKCNKFCDNC